MYRIVFLIIKEFAYKLFAHTVLQSSEFLLCELHIPAELLLYRIKTGGPPYAIPLLMLIILLRTQPDPLIRPQQAPPARSPLE